MRGWAGAGKGCSRVVGHQAMGQIEDMMDRGVVQTRRLEDGGAKVGARKRRERGAEERQEMGERRTEEREEMEERLDREERMDIVDRDNRDNRGVKEVNEAVLKKDFTQLVRSFESNNHFPPSINTFDLQSSTFYFPLSSFLPSPRTLQ